MQSKDCENGREIRKREDEESQRRVRGGRGSKTGARTQAFESL